MTPLRIFFPSTAELLTDHRLHGEGLIAWDLLTTLAARGHEIVACAPAADIRGEVPFELRVLGHGSARVESASPLLYALKAARELRRFGGAKRFDVCHWLFPQQAIDVFPRPLPFFMGPLMIPWGERIKHGFPGRQAELALAPAYKLLRRRAIGRARAIFLTVPAAGATLPASAESRVRVAPFGIHTSEYSVEPLPETPVVTFLGRLDRQKGIYELIEAFALARRRDPRLVLKVAGRGEDEEVERRCVAAGLAVGQDVELLGAVPHGEIRELLAASSLLCLPSHGEPFGMVLLEAMASGRALIASAVGGPREIVTDGAGGRLVPPGDIGALADAIVELAADRNRLRAIGEFNRAEAERRFDWLKVIEQLELAYRQA
jgi:glycosyltransferase involved in cell wall biosynthesis